MLCETARSARWPARRNARLTLLGAALLVIVLAVLAASRVIGLFEPASPVVIAVEPGQDAVAVPAMATGINTAVWDNHLLDAAVPALLRRAGVGLVRYPGGSTADVYHWRTNTITPGKDGYANPANTFDTLMSDVATPSGARALITVNYGSNATGTGGGDPGEAAAWVYYANRVHHDAVPFWEIGNELYGNGYYGRPWETDLHADHSPTAYATNALAYIKVMKAVDPTIKVGLDLVVPGDWPDGLGPQPWNATVLRIACRAADFVSLHWYAEQSGSPGDSSLLNRSATVPSIMAQVRTLLNQYCGAHAAHITIMLTETNSAGPDVGKQTVSPINGLFLMQDYLSWLQAGATTVAWWDLHNGPQVGSNTAGGGNRPYGDLGLLSSGTGGEPAANTPFPAFTALTVLAQAFSQGAAIVRCSATITDVTAFALQQSDNQLGLILVNTSSAQKYTVTPSVAGVGSIVTATATGFSVATPRLTTRRLPIKDGKVSYSMPPYSALVLELTVPPGELPPLSAPATTRPSATPGGKPLPAATPAALPSATARRRRRAPLRGQR